MAIYTSQQKKQKYMIWIFFGVLIITGIVLYFGFLKDKIKISGISIPIFGTEQSEIIVDNININFDILDKKEFKDLTPFQDALPFGGKIGREDPFKPNL